MLRVIGEYRQKAFSKFALLTNGRVSRFSFEISAVKDAKCKKMTRGRKKRKKKRGPKEKGKENQVLRRMPETGARTRREA